MRAALTFADGLQRFDHHDDVPWPCCTHRTCARPADVLVWGTYVSHAIPCCAHHADGIGKGIKEQEVLPVTSRTWTAVRDRLIRDGYMTSRGTTRRARATRCRGCGADVLHGLDADIAATPIEVDPYPLGPLGEVLALTQGRRTAALVSREGKPMLNYRDAGRINHHPAGTPGVDVYAEHRCTQAPCGPTIDSSWERVAAVSFAGLPPY